MPLIPSTTTRLRAGRRGWREAPPDRLHVRGIHAKWAARLFREHGGSARSRRPLELCQRARLGGCSVANVENAFLQVTTVCHTCVDDTSVVGSDTREPIVGSRGGSQFRSIPASRSYASAGLRMPVTVPSFFNSEEQRATSGVCKPSALTRDVVGLLRKVTLVLKLGSFVAAASLSISCFVSWSGME